MLVDPMPQAADPERYLRLAAERSLLDGEHAGPFGGTVVAVASAFGALGVLPAERARAIATDYGLANVLRGRGAPMIHRPAASSAARKLRAPRVVPLDAEIALAWGSVQVHYVSLGDDSVVVGITAREGSPGAMGRAGQPPQAQVTDDQGATVMTHFAGGGGPAGWTGTLTSQGPLSRTTRWLEVGPTRFELPDDAERQLETWVEDLAPRPPALAYLWHRMATSHGPMQFHQPTIDAVIDALVAVGALDDAEPDIASLRLVASGRPGMPGHPLLPEPWASVLVRPGMFLRRGPTGVAAIGAVVGPVDGITAVLEVLQSDPEGCNLQVVTSPPAFPNHHDVDAPTFAWWAEDDRGGVYLGFANGWSGGADQARGTLRFGPLDPEATELRIMPTGLSQRAVVRVPLSWGRAR